MNITSDISSPPVSILGTESSRCTPCLRGETFPVRVTVAVVTANRSDMLDACLSSLLRSDYSLHEILVYDNASKDDTPNIVRTKYPQACLCRNERNMGLSFCHNRAMREFTGDCVFLVDDDNEMEPDMLRLLVEHMFAPGNERIGIVAPVIYDFYDKPVVVLSGGSTSMWSGRNLLNSKQPPYTVPYFESKRASNSTMIRREVVEQCGLMDDQLFSTSADEDYIRRMNLNGWTCHFVLAASIYHKAKPTDTKARHVGITNPARAYILARNRTILVRRYASWCQLLVFLLVWQHMFNAFYLYVLFTSKREWRFIRAYLLGWLHAMRYVLTKRLPPLEYVLKMTGS